MKTPALAQQVQAVFFDIDGTLVSLKTRDMPASTRAALQALRGKGIRLFVATGRSPRDIEALRLKLGFDFDAYLALNGQYCFHDKGLLHTQRLPLEDLQAVVPYMEAHGIACDFVEESYTYRNMENEAVRTMTKTLGSTAFPTPLDDTARIYHNATYQITPYINEEEEVEFMKRMPGCKSARWIHHSADIVPVEGGKGEALKKVLAAYNIPVEASMAFGDGGNDIDMLETAGIGVAVGGAAEDVKAAADYVAPPVEEDGIAVALRELGVL